MANLAVIVDSGAGLSKEWYGQHGILVAQHSVAFPGEEPLNDLDVSPREFFSRLREAPAHPQTANPNPAEFSRQYDAAFKNGASNVLALTMMKDKSGAYNSAVAAAEDHGRKKDIVVLDSHTVGPAQAFMALDAKRYFGQNGLHGIEWHLGQLWQQTRIYVVPKNLSFLATGGRVKEAAGLASSQLKLAAVISIVQLDMPEGEKYNAVPVSRHRILRQALDSVVKNTSHDSAVLKSQGFGTVDMAVIHSGNEAAASNLESRTKPASGSGLTSGFFYSGFMTPVLGRQFGPGAVGIAMLYRLSS